MLPNGVYRVDTRPPDIVFQAGFRRFGNNVNLEHHVTGRSNLGAAMQGQPMDDAYLNTSTTIEDSVRHLAPLEQGGPQVPQYLGVYEVRPTSDFYELQRTAAHFIDGLRDNPGSVPDPLRRIELNSIFSDLVNSVTSEGFSVENIPTQLIARAYRIDLGVFINGLPLVETYNPINNNNYQQGPANPNPNPYNGEGMIDINYRGPHFLAMDNERGFVGNVAVNTYYQSEEFENEEYLKYLYLKSNLIQGDKKDIVEILKKYFSTSIQQDLPLIEIHNGHKGNLGLQNLGAIRNTYGAKGGTGTYDQHGRIGCYFKDKPFLFYCLTATNVKNYDGQYLNMMPAVIADKTQQGDLKLSDDKKTIKFINKAYPDMLIGSHYINFRDYLTIRKANSGKEEVRIEYDKLKDKTIFNKSYIPHNLYGFDLKGNNNGVFYYPILSGSTSSKREDAEILYFKDFSYIVYIQISNGKMGALTNKRQSQDDGSGIAGEEIDYKEFENLPTNPRRMGKITDAGKNTVEINNYGNDDILGIQTSDVKGGSYFTSRKTSDYGVTSDKRHLAVHNFLDEK